MTAIFDDEFKARVMRLERDAEAAGTNVSELCRVAGISRATPDRWRTAVPKTVRALAALERALVARRGRGEVSES